MLACITLAVVNVLCVCGCGGDLPYNKYYKSATVNSISHLQGMAYDGTYFYLSFTNIIAKMDKNGNTVATLVLNDDDGSGFIQSPHLGDCTYYDGKLYVSYTPKTGYTAELTYDFATDRIAYAFIVEVDKLTQMNQTPDDSFVSCAYLGDALIPYATAKWWQDSQGNDIPDARIEGENRPVEFDDDTNKTYVKLGGKYGLLNSLDAVTVAPQIGNTNSEEQYLTYALNAIGYGDGANAKYSNNFAVTDRLDNDYLVIGQVPISKISQVEVPYSQIATAPSIGLTDLELYFFYCGYHEYMGQTVTYDAHTKTLMVGLYDTVNSIKKLTAIKSNPFYDGKNFPAYNAYAIDITSFSTETLIGNGTEQGKVLQAKYGDLPTQYGFENIKGFSGRYKQDFCIYNGAVSLGGGYIYSAHDLVVKDPDDDTIVIGHAAELYLHKLGSNGYALIK